MECEFCGHTLPEGARFCPNCGTAVATTLGTEERKMVTVLFADLVDSTGLADRLDPERARDVLGGFFDVASEELRALRGRPEKFIGDAVMAVFGLPHVHEDDAVRAVRAGLAIRDRMERLRHSLGLEEPLGVRVGVESGEAATGVGPTGQVLVTGPVVNAAARLQTAARPGEVLVGATTHTLTKASVSFGQEREIEAKGFAGTIRGHPVEELSTRSARRTIPFVGRSNELDILRGAFARVNATSSPLLVSILGEPGVGKSRLADEVMVGFDDGVTVLKGRAQAYGDTATFAPITAIVRELAGIDIDMAPDDAMARLREVVDGCCDPGEAERAAGRLGLTIGVGEPRHRDESIFVQDVQNGFLTLVDGLSRHGSVVLVFEDVHTLHGPMLDLIERLATTTRHGPERALTIALGRPELLEKRQAWASGAVNAVTLRLEPLPLDEAVELVREAAGGRIGDREAEEIASRTGGNPFFIVETTGMVLRTNEQGETGSSRTLPPTVQAVVAARLDGLPHGLRNLARRASVFIYSFDLDELGTIAEAVPEDVRALEEAEILVRDEGAVTVPRWRFRHQTVHEVAYASLPKRERRTLHERVADALVESGHRSYAADHLELAAQASLDLDPADRRLPDRAVDALIAAGDRARRRMESRSAVDFYARALTMAGPEDAWAVREARALAGTGEAHYWLGEYPAASEALARAVALGEAHDDAWTLALALRYQGDIAINVDRDIDKAEELLANSLAAAGELDEPWALSRSLLFAGWVPWTREDYDEADQIWRRALALAEEHGDDWGRVRALTALSINHSQQKDLDESERLIEEASAIADEMGDRFSVAVTTVQRGRLDEDRGRFEDAIPRFDRAIEIFDELGARWEMADALAERGISYRDLGRFDEGEEDLRTAIRISQELGEQQIAGWTGRALDRLSQLRAERAGERVTGA